MELFGIESPSSLALIFEKKELPPGSYLIISDSRNLEKLKSFLHFKKSLFPWYELPAFPKPKSPAMDSPRLKRKKWQAWAAHPPSDKACLFLATPQALLKKTHIISSYIIEKKKIFNPSALRFYREKSFVEQEGDFSSKGFLIDIFSPAYNTPLRVELLGQQVQSIHLLDRTFKKRQEELKQALITPLYEWSFEGALRKKLCDHLREREKLLNRSLPSDLFKSFARGELYFGFESLVNCLDQTCSLDYFHTPPQIWLFEPEKTKAHFFKEQSHLVKEHPFFTPAHLFLGWNKLVQISPQTLKAQAEAKREEKLSRSLDHNQISEVHIIRKKKELKALSKGDTLKSQIIKPEEVHLKKQGLKFQNLSVKKTVLVTIRSFAPRNFVSNSPPINFRSFLFKNLKT